MERRKSSSNAKGPAPPNCYWRGEVLWGRTEVHGREFRWSLETADPKIAGRRFRDGKNRLIAEGFGDASRTFTEVVEAWGKWITKEVRPKAVNRYLSSLHTLSEWVADKPLAAIDSKLIAEIIRARSLVVSNATVKRDLGAMSSVFNYAMDQGWVDANPVLPRLRRIREIREPITLPRDEDIALVKSRAPGMIKDLVEAATMTGAREDELLKAKRRDLSTDRRHLTLVGKRGKRRTIDLDPFGGVSFFSGLIPHIGTDLLFWHSEGESYKNFASQFAEIVRRTAVFAEREGIDFRSFRFHDLRHLHAIEWLKSGRGIWELQQRLGHASVKTTEGYLLAGYLTFEEQQAARNADTGHRVGTKSGTGGL